MATVLELAREVRHRLISKDTGRLTINYPDETVTLSFWRGVIASDPPLFLSCFERTPSAFQFKLMDVPDPGESGHGVSLLVEAIEAIDEESFARAWEPYAEWKIGFKRDPEIHNTLVKEHLAAPSERLRRVMRLVVSGSATLSPTRTEITDEMDQIDRDFQTRNWRKVLSVNRSSNETEIRQAYRKLARRFHPDRWVASPDMQLRDRIEKTFQRVSHAYKELRRSGSSDQEPIGEPKPEKAFWERLRGFVRSK